MDAPTCHGDRRLARPGRRRAASTPTVALPGSKSLTNRYLVLAALATARPGCGAPLRSRDTLLMAAGAALAGRARRGRRPATTPSGERRLAGHPARRCAATSRVDCGLAGTVMRFLPPVAALRRRAGAPSTATRRPGSGRWRPVHRRAARPRGRRRRRRPRHAAVHRHGPGRVPGGTVTLDASASSQFISALLLAGARFDEGVTVHHDGKPVPSEPHIQMTVETLRDAGVDRRRQRAQHLAGRAVRDQRPRRAGRARPVQRRAVPRRGAGHRRHACGCRAGRSTPPRPATRIRDILDAMGADVQPRPRRAHRHRRGRARRASTSTCTTSAS